MVETVDLSADPDSRFIERVYYELLRPAFPPEELDPLEVIRDGLMGVGKDEIVGLCARRGADEPVGCIIAYPYRGSGVLLIGYLAVRADMRSKGIGSLLLDKGRSTWYGAPWCQLVVAEIEDPRHYPRGETDPARRAAFWFRHGAELLLVPFFQPRVREQLPRVYDMFLVVLDAKPAAMATEVANACSRTAGRSTAAGRTSGRAIRSEVLLRFLEEYFTASEGPDSVASDPEFRWLFNRYGEQDSIRLVPLDIYRGVDLPRVPREPAT